MLDLTLYIPALFDIEIDAGDDQPTGLSALEFLLARGRKTAAEEGSCDAALCQQFGYSAAANEDLPLAAIGRLIDDDKRPKGYWMRADPVHLHADQKSLSLLDCNSFSLTQHDSLALAACVRQSFTELGWELEVPVPTRWYVQMDKKPAIRTSELQAVVGRDIRAYMPSGDDAAVWHRLMNEIQMQLHSADINQLRMARGELAVNSLWLWGTGALPDLLQRRWSRVYCDDNTSMGLSMLSNTPCLPLPEKAAELFTGEGTRAEILVVLSAFQTVMVQKAQGQQRLVDFANNWCEFLLQQLREGNLHSLRIITRAGEFELNKRSLLKFWKKTRAFNDYVS